VRVVLDTNVVASALLWGGTPERLIELAGEGTLELVTSGPDAHPADTGD
jgi:predicted nucleic acid-binding protein